MLPPFSSAAGRDTLGVPFLKLEKENFGPDGERQQLYAYCVSAKLYCLFNFDDGNLIRKPSGHGLGFLRALYSIANWQRRKGRKWKENLPPWIFEAWHFILSRELGLPHQPPRWLKQPAVMVVPVTTPQALERLGCFKDVLRPFTVVMVPSPRKEVDLLRNGFLIIPYMTKLNGEPPHLTQNRVSRSQCKAISCPRSFEGTRYTGARV